MGRIAGCSLHFDFLSRARRGNTRAGRSASVAPRALCSHSLSHAPRGNNSRQGFTLIELLIVVSLLVLMAAMVLPRLKPAMEGRRSREAARALHLYVQSARANAIATGRPCGVMIERMLDSSAASPPWPMTPSFAMTASQVEVPPFYSGDELTSMAQVQYANKVLRATITPPTSLNLRLVSIGDRIQFNYQGPWYKIAAISNAVLTLDTLELPVGQLLPWANLGPTGQPLKVPFKIMRQPVKSGAAPLQLPAATCVDLQFSGMENDMFVNSTWDLTADMLKEMESGSAKYRPNPILIIFAPNGSISQVWRDRKGADGQWRYEGLPCSDPVYLLVGKREKMIETEPEKTNLADLTNLFVGINAWTGLVTTENIAPGNDPRAYVREGRNAGGR